MMQTVELKVEKCNFGKRSELQKVIFCVLDYSQVLTGSISSMDTKIRHVL